MPPVTTIKNMPTRLIVSASDLIPTQNVASRPTVQGRSTFINQIIDVVGTMAEILETKGVAGAYSVHARPSDVVGCTAEYSPGYGWIGCLGVFASDSDFSNSIPSTVNVGALAWSLVGNATTGTAMKVLQ